MCNSNGMILGAATYTLPRSQLCKNVFVTSGNNKVLLKSCYSDALILQENIRFSVCRENEQTIPQYCTYF